MTQKEIEKKMQEIRDMLAQNQSDIADMHYQIDCLECENEELETELEDLENDLADILDGWAADPGHVDPDKQIASEEL